MGTTIVVGKLIRLYARLLLPPGDESFSMPVGAGNVCSMSACCLLARLLANLLTGLLAHLLPAGLLTGCLPCCLLACLLARTLPCLLQSTAGTSYSSCKIWVRGVLPCASVVSQNQQPLQIIALNFPAGKLQQQVRDGAFGAAGG